MGRKLRVIVCRVGRAPAVELLEQRRGSYLDAMQDVVGGYIEYLHLGREYAGIEAVLNEDGFGLGLALNRVVPATAPARPAGFEDAFVVKVDDDLCDPGERGVYRLHGDFFFTRTDEHGEAADVTDADVRFWTDRFEAEDRAAAMKMNRAGGTRRGSDEDAALDAVRAAHEMSRWEDDR
jgi:hypothetical protein